MSLEKINYEFNDWDLACDGAGCDESDFFDDPDFQDMIDEIKSNGWKITKNKFGEWVHYCPECRKKIENAGKTGKPQRKAEGTAT